MHKIVQKDDPVLRKKAENIPTKDIASAKIQKILKNMNAALAEQKDGVAIAAPQIGVPLRIFVVSGKVTAPEGFEEAVASNKHYDDLVFINPEITRLSREKYWIPEGCLSVRWKYGKVCRAKKASILAYNEKGEKISRGASGLLAQIFQHETDHLDGVLFIDKAKDIEEIPPEK